MSEENVEIGEPVRRLLAALNKRDWVAFSVELDPEVEYAPVEEHATFRGPEALVRYAEQWFEAWDTFSVEAEEVESTATEPKPSKPPGCGSRISTGMEPVPSSFSP